MVSSITQKTDKFVDTKTEHSTIILKDKKTIWNRGTYPPPESHTLKIPFQFSLSDTLLPTCKHRAKDYGKRSEIVGEVSYHLEVVGTRGALHSKRRERTAFKILPPSIRGAQLQDRLTPTWTGDWRAVTRHINIPVGRRRQRTSRVEMQVGNIHLCFYQLEVPTYIRGISITSSCCPPLTSFRRPLISPSTSQ